MGEDRIFQAMATTEKKNRKSESPGHDPSQRQTVLGLSLSSGGDLQASTPKSGRRQNSPQMP